MMIQASSLRASSSAENLPPPTPEEELEAAYREHCEFVWRNARRLGCDEATAEDVVHDVFLVAVRRLREFRGDANLRTWLFAITYRVVQRTTRDRARRGARLRDYAASQVRPSICHPHDQVDAGEALRRLLVRLDEAKRVVFILAELEGMTSVEIGACLGLNPRTVESRLRAARQALTRMIERDGVGERSRQR